MCIIDIILYGAGASAVAKYLEKAKVYIKKKSACMDKGEGGFIKEKDSKALGVNEEVEVVLPILENTTCRYCTSLQLYSYLDKV